MEYLFSMFNSYFNFYLMLGSFWILWTQMGYFKVGIMFKSCWLNFEVISLSFGALMGYFWGQCRVQKFLGVSSYKFEAFFLSIALFYHVVLSLCGGWWWLIPSNYLILTQFFFWLASFCVILILLGPNGLFCHWYEVRKHC